MTSLHSFKKSILFCWNKSISLASCELSVFLVPLHPVAEVHGGKKKYIYIYIYKNTTTLTFYLLELFGNKPCHATNPPVSPPFFACASGKSAANTTGSDNKGPRTSKGRPNHHRSLRKRLIKNMKPYPMTDPWRFVVWMFTGPELISHTNQLKCRWIHIIDPMVNHMDGVNLFEG